MIGSVERYSTSGKRRAGIAIGRVARALLIAFVLYLLVTRLFVATFRIDSRSMEPTIAPSDRVIVSLLSFGARIPFARTRLPGLAAPERGDLVVVQPPFLEQPGVFARLLEPIASFFTFQRVTLHRNLYGERVNGFMVKRLIGIPGDTVRMKDFILSIRAKGGSSFVPEQQLIPGRYEILTQISAAGWSSSLPFSGNAPDLTLSDDEYYVLGDNRPTSSDSRSWGVLSRDRIIAKVVYRYWPPRSIGKL
jgi:signal peptidase I